MTKVVVSSAECTSSVPPCESTIWWSMLGSIPIPVVSTASLMIGVAAASASKEAILIAGIAGLVAVHMRDELGLDDATMARPLQAAMVSAASFAGLGLLPVLTLVVAPASIRMIALALVSLGLLGALGGRLVVRRSAAHRCAFCSAAERRWPRPPSSVTCGASQALAERRGRALRTAPDQAARPRRLESVVKLMLARPRHASSRARER